MPSVLSILPEYKGLTTEDITNMYSAYNTGLEKAREKRDSAYEKYGEAYSKLGALRSILERYKKTGEEGNVDQEYIEQYNAYVQGLEDSVNALMQSGYNTKTAWDIARLSGDFYNMYTPISAADTARTAAIKAYNEKMQDNQHVASYNPNESSLSDYINGVNQTPTYVSYDDIYKQAVATAAAYARRHQYYDFKSMQDKSNQFDAGDKKYGVVTKVTGFNNSYDYKKDSFLSGQVDSILSQYGITKGNGFSNEAIESAKQQIYDGYRDGITYSLDSDLENIGYSDVRRKEIENAAGAGSSKEAEEQRAAALGLVSTNVYAEDYDSLKRKEKKSHNRATKYWSILINNSGEDQFTQNKEKLQGTIYVFDNGDVEFYDTTNRLKEPSSGPVANLKRNVKEYFSDETKYQAYRQAYQQAYQQVYGKQKDDVTDSDVIGYLAAYYGLVDNKITNASLYSNIYSDDSEEDEGGGDNRSNVDPQFDFDD